MGTLRYAILGLLNRRDMSGYDLTKEFETTLAEFWGAKHSQIYPELKALADEGLIAYQIEISGTVLEKKVYSITERGRTALQTWAETQLKMKSVPKDEFRLQLYFSDCIPPQRRIALLEPQLEQHRALLDHLRENTWPSSVRCPRRVRRPSATTWCCWAASCGKRAAAPGWSGASRCAVSGWKSNE